ncbi:MAG: aminopeptidase P family N-terminal domain-containing protein, partial [Pseudomonadota bacterium]
MFQDYAVTSNPDDGPPRVAALRNAMAAAGVDGFLVPRADAHQGEQVAPRDARLAWLTGFTGSAGLAVILADRAAMFVDGRYTLQVRAQCDAETFAFQQIPQDKPTDWAVGAMAEGMTLAFDPWLLTSKDVETWEAALGPAGILFKPVSNLVDAIWDDQPSAPMGPVVPHDAALAGRTHGEKREEIGAVLREAGVQAAVLSLPDSICWLLNIRGSDIERVPIVQGFTIVHASGAVDLFTDPGKLTDAAAAHLGDAVSISPPAVFGPSLRALEGKIGVDKGSAPVWVAQEIEAGAGEIHWMRDPCILPKAIKTEAELSGARLDFLGDPNGGGALVDADLPLKRAERRPED